MRNVKRGLEEKMAARNPGGEKRVLLIPRILSKFIYGQTRRTNKSKEPGLLTVYEVFSKRSLVYTRRGQYLPISSWKKRTDFNNLPERWVLTCRKCPLLHHTQVNSQDFCAINRKKIIIVMPIWERHHTIPKTAIIVLKRRKTIPMPVITAKDPSHSGSPTRTAHNDNVTFKSLNLN